MRLFTAFVLALAGTGAAASAQSSGEVMEAFVACKIYGPPDRAAALGFELTNVHSHVTFWSQPVSVQVSRADFERTRPTLTLESWHEHLRDQTALKRLYWDDVTEKVGLPFARFVWGDRLGSRPPSEAAIGKWRPSVLYCIMEKDRARFSEIIPRFDPKPASGMYQIPTDWTLGRTVSLTAADIEPVVATAPRRGGHIVIQDATPTQASPEQRAAALLQSQREDAARMAKAAAESARNNADLQAKIAKAVEEARKRGNKQ